MGLLNITINIGKCYGSSILPGTCFLIARPKLIIVHSRCVLPRWYTIVFVFLEGMSYLIGANDGGSPSYSLPNKAGDFCGGR